MATTKLTPKLRAEVVIRFARWESPKQVQRWLKEDHGVDIGLPGLTPYNFDNPESRRTGTAKWIQLFDDSRELAKTEISDIPTAHKAVRMMIRDREIMRLARSMNPNVPLLTQLLEAQAKEEGGMFTNRRELTGADGGPIQTEDTTVRDLSNEDLVALALQLAGGGDAAASN